MTTATGRGGMTFTEALNRAPMRPFQWLTIVICMAVLVCDGIDLQLLGIVAPLVLEDFGVARAEFGWAMGSALVGFGVGSWAGGWMGDRIGRRWTMAIAAVVFSLATIGAGSADGVWSMAFWRLVSGLGFGGAYANTLTMASEWTPDRWRPVTVSTLSVGTPLGGTIVGWLGPDLAASRGWDGTFVVFGFATLAMVAVILIGLRDSPAFLIGRGKTEVARRNASLVLAEPVELATERHASDDASGAAVGVFHRGFLRLNAGIALAFTAAALVAYGILNWATIFLTAAGWTLADAGQAISIGGLTSMAGSILVGMAMRQFGSKIVMGVLSVTLVALLLTLGAAVEALPAQGGGDVAYVTTLVGITAALFSASIAGMYVIMAAGYPPSCRSQGMGFGIFMSRIGAVTASVAGGWLLDLGGTSVWPFFGVLAAGAALIAAAAFIVDRHVPPARAAVSPGTRTA